MMIKDRMVEHYDIMYRSTDNTMMSVSDKRIDRFVVAKKKK